LGFARTPADREAALVLACLRGISPGRLLELAQVDRTAGALLQRVRAGFAGSENDRVVACALRANAVAESVERIGARFVAVGDPSYPARLEHLEDPPLGLFVRGRALVASPPIVALVGARNCSDLGAEVARDLGRTLAGAGVVVASGAARGIDAASHEGALDGGGWTVAVLGNGLDVDVPAATRALLERIAEHGTLVSEYPPGVPGEAFRFPARNRIVAALARALVVVEGGDRSGSLISAEHALDLGRDVLAVPGAVNNPLSAAPNRLIREGATLLRGPDDLLQALGVGRPGQASLDDQDLSSDERSALAAVRGPVVPDRVAADLGCTVPDALALLLRLEMRGLVRSVGGRFERRFAGSGSGVEPDGRARVGQDGLGRSGPRRRGGGPPAEA
jgi:DNA processing protein